MSSYHLDVFFRPRNVIVVGASAAEGTIGQAVTRNLLSGKYRDKVYLIHPDGGEIEGLAVLTSVDALEIKPDLAIVALAPDKVAPAIKALGEKGCRGAVVITTEMGGLDDKQKRETMDAAADHKVRLIGPNCMGIQSPRHGLNASYCHVSALSGDLALISQSGAITASVADWASHNNIGFSGLISLGDKADVDFADMMDHFAMDPHTRAILLYVETIINARKFMSSARAAARTKPVVLIKSGRHAEGASAFASRNNKLVGADAAYDAAFERTGLLRVHDLDEFFAAVETLTHVRKLNGSKLTVMTNSAGIGVLAVDDLIDHGGSLATLEDSTIDKLDAILPASWSRSNPVNIVVDSGPQRYKDALDILMEDRNSHAILVMTCPTALATGEEAAKAIIDVIEERKKAGKRRIPVFAAWLGGGETVNRMFEAAGIPHYPTPADALRGFSYVVRYMEAQDQLMRMPPAIGDFQPDYEAARTVIDDALHDSQHRLNAVAVTKLLEAYDIPIAPSYAAPTAVEAAQKAAPLIARYGSAVVKIDSPDILYKSDIGGVVLHLGNTGAVATAAQQVMTRAREANPEAVIDGVTVHPMVRKPHSIELFAGMNVDPIFGPVMVFGRGGTAVEVIRDKAMALPPLDPLSALRMIEKTRVNRRLEGYRDTPACDRAALAQILVKMSRMVADFPEIAELDFNPLLADAGGFVIADARVEVIKVPEGIHPHNRFAVKPYPHDWEQVRELKNGRTVFIRPMKPEDEALFPGFFDHVTDEDMRLRFFSAARTMTHAFISRLTQIDYARSMAFIAVDPMSGEMLASVRLMGDGNHETGEYAVMVRSDLKGLGLGWIMMKLILQFAEKDGFREVAGEVLRSNKTMRQMCEALGFETRTDPDDPDLVHMVFKVPEIGRKIADLI
ncbi:acetyltransferase [Cohaesibacter sp. ES.047]|uniref:bifunctional acetate--CoA ligase family protein/GNAT family N-acetyltransferase n=1 Tax=Cohaesibacter sp. ES.047 TaxID=1798205 RepID=UPI000BB96CB4|nr:acetate--CoA ligase family protein [Cohaesibacter sp. ES.047]SNY92016.1 acetyltransferase [Cohaesibacter sp. ES.047]